MNKRQKLVQQKFLNNEEAVISRLEQVYGVALDDINAKIDRLMKQYDPVTGNLSQSAIYQIKHQEMLKAQLEGVLAEMQRKQFLTVSDYLDTCYEDGFVGALFDQHGQGVPFAMPIDQESMVRAVQLDSKISQGLYTRLGEDVNLLKKKITAQVSRSIATGVSFQQTAQQLAGYSRIGYNNAIRIARTEGHRIQCTATHDAAIQAKERGADVVKQWDSTLDGKTRSSHIAVDGEIRELDEHFSNDLMFPGDPEGEAAEVINCRCAYLQRARWALGNGFTKRNNFTKELESFDSPQDYDEFKKGFFSPENKKFMNYCQQMEEKYGKDWHTVLDQMTDREYKHYSKLLANNPLYNTKAPFTSTSADTFPDWMRKSSQGKKATQTWADILNGNTDLDPNIRALYQGMNDLPFMPQDCSISYTAKGHELSRSMSLRTGETTEAQLKVPKMVGDDLSGQASTAFHEMAHFIDMGCGDGKRLLKSEYWQELTDAVKRSGQTIPGNIGKLFGDFHSEYDKIRDGLAQTYKAKRSDVRKQYMDGIIPYDTYKQRWNALTREEEAERDYQCRNLMGGGVPGLSDIYDALSAGSYRDSGTLYYGHGGRYYSNAGNRNCEIFANYMSMSVNNPELVEMLRQDKPELCDALDKLIREMAGDLK
jgi:hypothetical protein